MATSLRAWWWLARSKIITRYAYEPKLWKVSTKAGESDANRNETEDRA